MNYYINLTDITINELKEKLLNTDILPSHTILKENIENNFDIIKKNNIKNLEELKNTLKTKKSIEIFSTTTQISIDYLVILRREINSYHPQERKIKDFQILNDTTKNKLINIGLKTTYQVYPHINTPNNRIQFQKKIGVSDEEILKLTMIVDLTRLRYVNHTFAELLIYSQYNTTEKIKAADYNELYKELKTINEKNKVYNGKIGLKDIKFLIDDWVYSHNAIEY